MEHASQALAAFNRKRTKPEESVPSSSGKISRTEKQYECPWDLLPEELVVSIFKLLPNKDLLACRAVCSRFVGVIGQSVLLNKAKAFWKQFSQPPHPELFSRDRYKQVLRPWLEAFVTAQQRLTAGASGDLQFSDNKREETEKQAASELNEQIQAIQPSTMEQLDRLIKHKEFPKVLFFLQTKKLQNAESLYFQEKISHPCPEIVKTVCFSPDGRTLLIPFGKTIRFMVLDGNGNVVRQYNASLHDTVGKLRFSPNGHTLLVSLRDRIMIRGLDGEDWVHKGEIRWNNQRNRPACFISPDSDSLAAVFDNSVLIMGRDEKGNWVQNSEIPTSRCAEEVCFSTDGGSLVISSPGIRIMVRDGKGSWVQNANIPDDTFTTVKSVCFSPDGGNLAILNITNIIWIISRDEKGNRVENIVIPGGTLTLVQSFRFSPDSGSLAILDRNRIRDVILIMRPDEKGNWVQNFSIPCDQRYSSLRFSPDGRNLTLPYSFTKHTAIVGLDGANSRVYKYEPFLSGLNTFSPDGGSLAINRGSTTWVMGLDKGKWVKKACITSVSDKWSMSPSPRGVERSPMELANESIEWHVRAVCFSPDSRRLAIISAYSSDESLNSQVSMNIYEIKTGAKVLTDRDKQFLKGYFSS